VRAVEAHHAPGAHHRLLPGFHIGSHAFDHLGMLGCDIRFFRHVVPQIVQFEFTFAPFVQFVPIVEPGNSCLGENVVAFRVPEPDTLRSCRHLSVEKRQDTDAVNGLRFIGDIDVEQIHDRRVDVAGHDRDIAYERLFDPRRPLDQARHAYAAFPYLPLTSTQNSIRAKGIGLPFFILPRAVVVIEPEHGVFSDTEFPQTSSQGTHAAIHPDHLGVVSVATRRLEVFFRWFKRNVRAAEPDHRPCGRCARNTGRRNGRLRTPIYRSHRRSQHLARRTGCH